MWGRLFWSLSSNFRHSDRPHCCFALQGTACITLAGILSALRANGLQLKDQRVLFYGAGEAGTGIGELISQALVKQAKEEGSPLTLEEARRHCFFMDSRGLVTASRSDASAGTMAHHKRPFAHSDIAPAGDLLSAVRQLRPSILVGVSTVANAFSQDVIEAMAEINTRPLIFPLSNPTSKAECSFEQAVGTIQGRDAEGSSVAFAGPMKKNCAGRCRLQSAKAVSCNSCNVIFLPSCNSVACMT